MKEILKKYLISLMSLFFVFSLVGCKKDEKDDKNELTKEEFYQKLVTLRSNMEDVKQLTVKGKSKVSMIFINEEVQYTTSIDLENNKYASVEKDSKGNVIGSEYVVKNGTDYIKYSYEADAEDKYESHHVGGDYVVNSFKTNDNIIDVTELNMDSYESFCESFEKMMSATSDDFLDNEELDNVEVNLDIYEESGLNYFSYQLVAEAEEDGAKVEISMSSVLSFNNEFIKGIDLVVKMKYKQGMTTSTMSFSNQTTYTKGYDDSLIPNSFASYPTDIEPAEFDVYFVVDGEETWATTDTYAKGETFAVDYYEDEIDNVTLDGWYLDKDCTISISTLTEYPSYDITLYANNKPNENYALIIITETIKTEDDWIFGPEIEKIAVNINEEYIIPSVIDIYGDEGTVVQVKVNGEEYTANTITLENRKIYFVELQAEE